MSEADDFDFVVIGGGSGGYAGASHAAALGLKVALVEGAREMGGLCILRGCMPSKTLIQSANRYMTLRRAREFGLRAENIAARGEEIIERKRRLVAEFADHRRAAARARALRARAGLGEVRRCRTRSRSKARPRGGCARRAFLSPPAPR